MQKKLIAVAVAGALGAPALALAQASTVQIYGKAVFEYGYANQGTGKPNVDFMQGPGGQGTGLFGMADYLSGGSTGSGVPGLAPAAASRVLWQRRQHDSINYDTPDFSGFKGHFAYSASNATLATNAHTSAKPRVWSV